MLIKRLLKHCSLKPSSLVYSTTTSSVDGAESKPRVGRAHFRVKRRFPLVNYQATSLKNAVISEEILRKATVAPEVLK